MCRGCTRINIDEVFFSDYGGIRPYFWVFSSIGLWPYCSFHFFVQQRVVPRNYYFCLYSNWMGGGDLDLIDFQLQILMHRQIYIWYK